MKMRDKMRQWLLPVVMLVATGLWLGAASRPFGTDPFSGGYEGKAFNITVTDTDIDAAFEVVNADSAANYTYTPVATDTTVMVKYLGGNGDTALVKITGIRPKRGVGNGNSYSAGRDTLAYVEKLLKVDGGDSVAVDSVLHMFEQAWVDSAKGALILVWAKGNSATGTPLVKIPKNRITSPIAHVLFGANDTPVLEQITYSIASSTSIVYELRQYPNIENALQYTNDYVVRDRVMVDDNNREITHVFPGGMWFPPRSYIAVMGLGGAANQTGTVTLIGKRRSRR